MSTTRIERDTFGPIEVPADRLWGAQTQRSLEHFRISTEKMPAALIRAMLIVKRSAARVNLALGILSPKVADAIVAACDETLAGAHAAAVRVPEVAPVQGQRRRQRRVLLRLRQLRLRA